MRKKFELDLTLAELSDNWPENFPLKIPIVLGEHYMDFDLDMSNIDEDTYRLMLSTLKKRPNLSHCSEDIPIGFSLERLPVGAVIKVC